MGACDVSEGACDNPEGGIFWAVGYSEPDSMS